MHSRNCPGEDHPKLKVLNRWPAAPQYKLNFKKMKSKYTGLLAWDESTRRWSFIREVTVAMTVCLGYSIIISEEVLRNEFQYTQREQITGASQCALCSRMMKDVAMQGALRSYPYVTAAGWLSLSLSVEPVVRAGVVVSATLFLESVWFYNIAS
jgi:hypothetical protein